MVFVFVHLQEIIMYIAGQVISKIGITGHHPRIISDDIARHDWFACSPSWAFFFPAPRSANLRSLIVLLDRSASIYTFSVMRHSWYSAETLVVSSGQPECASLSPDLPSPPEVDVSLLSPLQRSSSLRLARSSCFPPGFSRMVTSLESSEKDRICIASRLWLYC